MDTIQLLESLHFNRETTATVYLPKTEYDKLLKELCKKTGVWKMDDPSETFAKMNTVQYTNQFHNKFIIKLRK